MSLIVASLIPLTLLFVFIMMDLFKVSANLISLGAVDFGIIIDSAVVVVEALMVKMTLQTGPEFDHLGHNRPVWRLNALKNGLSIIIAAVAIAVFVVVATIMFRGKRDLAPWAVAIERPETGRRAVHGVLELEDLAVATSGDYRRYLDVGDARLAHTMDARRCAPVNNAVASVTVLARTCMHADAWATALLVTGPDEGLAMAQRMGMDVLFLLRRAEGLVEVGLGRFGRSADRSSLARPSNY